MITKSKVLSGIGLCVLLIGTGFISNKAFEIYFTRKNQSIKLDKAKDSELSNVKDYEKIFLEVYYSILFNSESSSAIVNLISNTWNRAIEYPDYYYQYSGFNSAISDVLDTLKQRGIIEQFQKTHSDIESKVSSLKTYPIKYKETYNALLDLYLIYSQIYDLSLHPTGSLLSFNNKIHDLESEYTKSLSKLKLFLPQAEEVLEDIERMSQITKEYSKIKEECDKINSEEGNKVLQAIRDKSKREEESRKRVEEELREFEEKQQDSQDYYASPLFEESIEASVQRDNNYDSLTKKIKEEMEERKRIQSAFLPNSEPDGFRAIKWGTNISVLSNMKHVRTIKDRENRKNKDEGWYIGIYKKIDDELKIENIPVESIKYYSWRDKFCGSVILIKGHKNWKELTESLRKKFGPGYVKTAPYLPPKEYYWSGDKTKIRLCYDEISKEGKLYIFSSEIIKEKILKDEEEEGY